MREAFSSPPATGSKSASGSMDMIQSFNELRSTPGGGSTPNQSHPGAMEGGAACVEPAKNPLPLKGNGY